MIMVTRLAVNELHFTKLLSNYSQMFSFFFGHISINYVYDDSQGKVCFGLPE